MGMQQSWEGCTRMENQHAGHGKASCDSCAPSTCWVCLWLLELCWKNGAEQSLPADLGIQEAWRGGGWGVVPEKGCCWEKHLDSSSELQPRGLCWC